MSQYTILYKYGKHTVAQFLGGNFNTKTIFPLAPVGGAVASWLMSSTPEPNSPGSSRGQGHCVVFLGKTLYSYSASLHPGI